MTVVLVTGGAGYIGSHTAKLLAAEGFTPVTLDNLERGHAEAVQWGPLVRADLADAAALDAAFAAAPARRGAAFRRLRQCGRVGRRPPALLPQQRGGLLEPPPGDAPRRLRPDRLLLDLRHLRRPRGAADHRGDGETPAQPLWAEQADGRADARRCRGRPRPAPRRAALFQRGRLRPRPRHRRGARPRDASDPARAPRRGRPTRPSRCSATTTPPRTAPASATIST